MVFFFKPIPTLINYEIKSGEVTSARTVLKSYITIQTSINKLKRITLEIRNGTTSGKLFV